MTGALRRAIEDALDCMDDDTRDYEDNLHAARTVLQAALAEADRFPVTRECPDCDGAGCEHCGDGTYTPMDTAESVQADAEPAQECARPAFQGARVCTRALGHGGPHSWECNL